MTDNPAINDDDMLDAERLLDLLADEGGRVGEEVARSGEPTRPMKWTPGMRAIVRNARAAGRAPQLVDAALLAAGVRIAGHQQQITTLENRIAELEARREVN